MTVDEGAPPVPLPGALRQSVFLLIEFAARATGAAGYSLCEEDPSDASGLRHYSSGSTTVRELSRASYPIRVQGNHVAILTFTFFESPISAEKLALLDRMAPAIDAVQAFPEVTARLAARIASLDVELADIKIVERTRGLLAGHVVGEDAVGAAIRHVEHVLGGRQLDALYDELLPHLEERVEERKLLTKAKVALQERWGISEEEAYLHMRIRSQSSRKRLREIASDLISQAGHQPRRTEK